jgi:hypothetical protein
MDHPFPLAMGVLADPYGVPTEVLGRRAVRRGPFHPLHLLPWKKALNLNEPRSSNGPSRPRYRATVIGASEVSFEVLTELRIGQEVALAVCGDLRADAGLERRAPIVY